MTDQAQREQIRRWAGCGFAVAIVVAPFLALAYQLEIGIAVMVVALSATAWLAYAGSRYGTADQRRRLRILAALNACLALAGVIVLIVRLN